MIELKQQLVESVCRRLNVGGATMCKITYVMCVVSSLQISKFAAEALLMSYGMYENIFRFA